MNKNASLELAIKDFQEDREFRQISKNTLTNYMGCIREFEVYCSGKQINMIEDITSNTIKSYLIYCQKERNNNPTTINSKLRSLKIFFNYLQEVDIYNENNNPVKKVKYIRNDMKVTTFSDAQIKKMLAHFNKIKAKDKLFYAQRDSMIIVFLLSTGCRLGELCNLKWEDIDFSNKHIIVFGKQRSHQGMPMADLLKVKLQEYKNLCKSEFKKLPEYVFVTREGEKLTENGVKNMFKRLKKEMKFKDVRCCTQDFRRYYAKSLILQGADAFTVQRLLRHSKLDMTLKYIGIFGQDLKQRNEQWNPVNKFCSNI